MIGAVVLAVTAVAVVTAAGIVAGRVAAGTLWCAVRVQGDPELGLAGSTAVTLAAAVISPGGRPTREPHCRHTAYEPNSAPRV